MAATNKPCPVCSLESHQAYEVNLQLDMGIPTTAIAEHLRGLGASVTPRQIDNHKRHRKLSIAPVAAIEPLENSEITNSYPRFVSENGLSNDQIQIRLLQTQLEAVDIISEQFKATANIKIARVLNELTATANGLIKDRIGREHVDPQISVVIKLGNLEDSLNLENT